MLYKDGNEENRKLAEKLLARLHGAVLALDDTSFRVIQNRKAVQKFRKRETWERLTDMDAAELKEHIAPIIKGEDEDIAARFFDATMLRILYDFVSSKDIMARAQAVEETDFWLNATATRIEQVREKLRSLMKFVEKEVTPRFYTDFTDTVETVREMHTIAPQTAPVPYKKRVEAYLREHQTNTAVFKLRTNKRLTKTDLEELERMLWQELGTAENYHETYGDMPVGRLGRETVGMEHAAVKQAFAEFLQENRLNSRQMDFVKRIISYFEHNGILEKKDIATKNVFKSAGNIEVLFKGKTAEVQHILAKVSEVTRNGTEIEIA